MQNAPRVEINVNFDCNLKCKNCNRLCHLMRLDEPMEVSQIQTFVDKLESEDKHITRVKVVGGEPTLHPQFLEICDVLSGAHLAGRIDKIAINTNGTTMSRFVDTMLPPGCRWMVSPPAKKTHRPYLWSPRDLGMVGRGPCKMVNVCGFSLDVRGWLPCSAAIAIARLFDLEYLYKPLDGPLPTKPWGMEELCPDCLHGVDDESVRGRHLKDIPGLWELPSPRWAMALWKYKARCGV